MTGDTRGATVRRVLGVAAVDSLPPGQVVRFRVVHEDGRRGSSWSVKTHATAGDVYVTHRDGGRWIHISLHQSGRWHHAVTRAGQELVPDLEPYLGVSTDHVEICPGWLHALRITVAATELRPDVLEAAKGRPIVEVPMLAGVEAVSIDVLLGAPESPPIGVGDAFTVANLKRGDGGTAVVVARSMSLDAPVHEVFARQVAQAVDELRAFGWDAKSATRLVIFGNDSGGFLREVEIAVDPDDGR